MGGAYVKYGDLYFVFYSKRGIIKAPHMNGRKKGVGEQESSCTWWEASEETEITTKRSTSNMKKQKERRRKCKKRI
ncbi:hypothetical protein HAX54_034684 [Datura stramonium]|uniref:Uncharacterized protein n=1 Tax=Datura stramonium TaxID=4076 RepID=A0ABS8VHJ2_DATST|nr:hypothetical protein [Datura stramonium]